MDRKERDHLMELFITEVYNATRSFELREKGVRYGPNLGHYGIYSRKDGRLDKNLCRAAAQRHLRETAEQFVKALVVEEQVYDPRFVRFALVFHKKLRRLVGLTNEVVQTAQFVCSPEGHKRGSGAMRELKQAVATYNEA